MWSDVAHTNNTATPSAQSDSRPDQVTGVGIREHREERAALYAGTETKYAERMTALRNLTLPTVPNLDIPPSPSESPPPAMTQKIAQFLKLKEEGKHFNEKLAGSTAMKNPSLFGKLITHAGLDYHEQYATTLPPELWSPEGLPSWAYKDELSKAQQEAQKMLEVERSGSRTADRFAPASGSSAASEEPSGRHSTAERVMSGLSRGRNKHSQNPSSGRDHAYRQ